MKTIETEFVTVHKVAPGEKVGRPLPATLALAATWKRVGGATFRSWYAHDPDSSEMISLSSDDKPTDLGELLAWLELNGYQREGDPGYCVYRRSKTGSQP